MAYRKRTSRYNKSRYTKRNGPARSYSKRRGSKRRSTSRRSTGQTIRLVIEQPNIMSAGRPSILDPKPTTASSNPNRSKF